MTKGDSVGGGTVRPVSEQRPQPLGPRLRLLREALSISQDGLIRESARAAARLGPNYKPLERTNYSAIENGRLQLTLDSTRGVLCAVFGLTRDELAEYLDGRCTLESVLASRGERLGQPTPRGGPGPTTPTYSSHPEWPRLVLRAQQADPELTDETFAELSGSPFFAGPLEALDEHLLAQVARALQNWRRRSKTKTP